MSLLRSITTIGGFTLISRMLGFVRDILIAAVLGAGPVADAFFVAFKFPNLFRRLFAEGAFNAAFVPIFSRTLEEEGEDAAKRFAAQAFSALLWTLVTFVIVIELFMPYAMLGFAGGFADEPEKFDLAVLLARITFPYLIFISLVSLLAGVLNSIGRFAAAAATPIILNICLISAVLGLAQYTETPGHALAWGVAVAGLAQFVWLMVHCARHGFGLAFVPPKMTAGVKRLLKRVLPGVLGAGVYQINLWVDTIIASFLASGSISYLYYADRVNQLPLGVIGVAVGTALLPLISRHLGAGDVNAANHAQNRAVEVALLFTVPAAFALVVMADPVIRVLFERNAFDVSAAQATGAALGVYALGLPAYVLNKALTPGFFAREDTATPVKIAGAAMVVNLVLNLILMGPYAHVGIAMATVVSAWLNVIVLYVILKKRGHITLDERLRARLPRTIAAAAIMAAALWGVQGELMDYFDAGETVRASALAALIGVGLITYALFAHLLGAARVGEIRGLLRK